MNSWVKREKGRLKFLCCWTKVPRFILVPSLTLVTPSRRTPDQLLIERNMTLYPQWQRISQFGVSYEVSFAMWRGIGAWTSKFYICSTQTTGLAVTQSSLFFQCERGLVKWGWQMYNRVGALQCIFAWIPLAISWTIKGHFNNPILTRDPHA